LPVRLLNDIEKQDDLLRIIRFVDRIRQHSIIRRVKLYILDFWLVIDSFYEMYLVTNDIKSKCFITLLTWCK
jgi:hypothetical protein